MFASKTESIKSKQGKKYYLTENDIFLTGDRVLYLWQHDKSFRFFFIELLVVPSLCGSISAYGHLAAFMREAPESQKHSLWSQVGQQMQQQVSDKPIWLNTAGAGVPWLHVRLDSRPKYYGYQPYKQVLN